jgi:hypothetical protein
MNHPPIVLIQFNLDGALKKRVGAVENGDLGPDQLMILTNSYASMLLRIAGNMLNLDVGTIKRKIDSNEYDDEILHEAQVTLSLLFQSVHLVFGPLFNATHAIRSVLWN